MKSGTSYVQSRLAASGEGLAAHGFFFPGGDRWRKQVTAVIDVLGVKRRGRATYDGKWAELAAEVNERPGTALISMEYLGPTTPELARTIVDSFPDTRVEVVITARDLARTLVAMWQETTKNARSWTYAEYLAAVEQAAPGPGKMFWRQQALARIINRWAEVVGIDAVTLVTLPPPGGRPEVMWERFCEAIRLPVDACAPIPPANESLGAASAAVLRRVNEQLESDDIQWADYSSQVKFGFAKSVLAAHRSAEQPIGLDTPQWVRERAASMRRNVEATGVRVIGTLDDLQPVTVPGVHGDEVSVAEQLDAAIHALTALLRRNIDTAAKQAAAKQAAATTGDTR